MALDLMAALRKLMADADADTAATDPEETPEAVAESNAEGGPEAADPNPNADTTADNPSGEPDAGDGTLAPTVPEPTSSLTDEQRDEMNRVAAENEALRREVANLRDIIASLGGDAAIGVVETPEEPVEYPEPDDEYDADADLAEQEAELARLRGE